MVSVSRVLSNYGTRPLINDYLYNALQVGTLYQPDSHRDLMNNFKITPECITFVSSIVTDVISDGYYFEGAKTNRDKAIEFCEQNNFNSNLEGWLFDMFIEGNGFMWKKKVSEEQLSEFVKEFMKKNGIETKEVYNRLYMKAMTDEEATRTQSLRVVAATTMYVSTVDKYASEILYEQRVGQYVSKFNQNEIIHIKDLNIDGKLWGYSRAKSILNEMQLLALLKDYQGAYFNNNGLPDGMIILPNELPDSPNYKLLVNTLKESKSIEKRHGVMVYTGEVQWEMFERMKDMEFKNLWELLVKTIAMVWQVPPSRYGGSSSAGREDSNLSNQGYYRNISHIQSKVEHVLNTQLFNEFKVKIKFNRAYREDEVREMQIEKIKTDFLQQRLQLGLITPKAACDILRIPEEQRPKEKDLGKPQVQLPAKGQFGQFNEGQSNKDMMMDESEMKLKKSKTPKNRSAFSDVR